MGPLEDEEDEVSKESVVFSELGTKGGKGGTTSAGARKPFLVAVADREFEKSRPFTLGAEATRRINLEAEAPTALGVRGMPVRERDGVGGGAKGGEG